MLTEKLKMRFTTKSQTRLPVYLPEGGRQVKLQKMEM
jgi:hypothetical protein